MNIVERIQELLEDESRKSIIPTKNYHVLYEAMMRIIALEKQLEKRNEVQDRVL